MYQVDDYEAAWNTDAEYEQGNLGHHTSVKGGYFPVPPGRFISGYQIRDVSGYGGYGSCS